MIIRNLDLARQILLRAEKNDSFETEDSEILYHLKALGQAGLVEGEESPPRSRESHARITGHLTRAGRDFLRLARDEELWDCARENFTKPDIFFSILSIRDFLEAKSHATNSPR